MPFWFFSTKQSMAVVKSPPYGYLNESPQLLIQNTISILAVLSEFTSNTLITKSWKPYNKLVGISTLNHNTNVLFF